MKDIIINVDSTSHKVNFPDEFLGIGYENLQGNIIFQFDNNFIGGEARLEVSIDEESGIIPSLTHYENGYILPIKSSLLTGTNVLMQLVIDETSLTKYTLTTDTQVNQNKTYYEKVGNDYLPVENPNAHDLPTYYEANTPVFKTDIFSLKVKDSINAQETIPEQYPTWINTFNILVATLNQKLLLVDQALTEMDNLNISVSNKVNGEVTITFTDKEGNEKVVKINDGRGIVSIIKTGTSGNVDTYTITYTDNTTSTFQVTNGIDGTDGVGIESIYLTGTSGLTDTYTILYTDGTTTEFQVKNGKGITKIEKISTNLLVDTYKITFNDGTTQNYEITNGKGIVSIEKTSTDGLTDIYTITYNDNTTTTFNVVNGKGIVSIEKTSTSGYVDTYTITYNDGTTTTYEVTNGEVSQAQLDALQDELNYYKTIVNALPKITGTGTYITLNNTANSILSNILNPNLSQETTTGKQLLNLKDGTYTGDNGGTAVVSNGEITLNGTASGNSVIYIDNTISLEAVQYTWSANNPVANSNVILRFGTNIMPDTLETINKTSTATLSSSSSTKLCIRIASGTTLTNFKLKPQMQTGATATEWEKYTGGIPAPNPQFPMPIHIISGNNTIKVEGSNLFDGIMELGIINGSTGNNISNSNYIRCKNYIPVEELTNYRITSPDYVGTILVYEYKSDYSYNLSTNKVLGQDLTLTTNSGTKYIRFRTNSETNDISKKFMVNKGTTALPYEPYVLQTAPLNLPVENLFDKDNANLINSYLVGTGNEILPSDGGTENKCTYIPCKPNTTYTIQKMIGERFRVAYTYELPDQGVMAYNRTGNNSDENITITTDSNAKYLVVYLRNGNVSGEITLQQALDSLQIEYGNKANSYTPFGTTPIEYCVIGNYADIFFKNVISSPLYNATLELDKWYLQKNINKIILDGSESWTKNTAAVVTNAYINNDLFPNRISQSIIYSNYFSRINSASGTGIYNGIDLNICMEGSDYDTATKFNAWLSNHNTNVYYPLSTPTYILLNDTLQSQLEYIYNQMLAYKGQTNISQINNDLPFIIDSTALKDLTNL